MLAQREVASKGGQASGGSFEPGSEKAKEAGQKGRFKVAVNGRCTAPEAYEHTTVETVLF